ncbi:VOC family protein [Parvularcula marina]|uniref:VOC family protein n=1 Tax=Parvularcula marina TaxID=2292771 RepID=A0A371RKB3_9PROT|nr:VOC family protein [Parvularcula marina]RFB05881.1 VOC family protein [Parvularcula marina]
MTVHGQFHWNELMTRNAGKAKDFYADTIGWTFEEMNMGEGPSYFVAHAAGGPVAGIFTMQGPEFDGTAEGWMAYLHVDDLDEALEKARMKGAIILRAPFDVPDVGRIAMLKEPGGAVIGWMTPAAQS